MENIADIQEEYLGLKPAIEKHLNSYLDKALPKIPNYKKKSKEWKALYTAVEKKWHDEIKYKCDAYNRWMDIRKNYVIIYEKPIVRKKEVK